MYFQKSAIKLFAACTVAAVFVLALPLPVAADNALYYFSPAAADYTNCDTQTVNLMLTVNGQINATDVEISYDSTKVENVTVAPAGYWVDQEQPGDIKLAVGYSTQAYSGTNIFATISFTPIPDAGPVTFVVVDAHAADATTSDALPIVSTNGNYSFICTAASPTPATNPPAAINSGTPVPPTSATLTSAPVITAIPQYQVALDGAAVSLAALPDVLQGSSLQLSGLADPNTAVAVQVHTAVQEFNTQSDALGKWQVNVATQNLDLGAHTFKVVLRRDNVNLLLPEVGFHVKPSFLSPISVIPVVGGGLLALVAVIVFVIISRRRIQIYGIKDVSTVIEPSLTTGKPRVLMAS